MNKHLTIVLGCLCLVCLLGVTTSVPAADLAHRWSFNGNLADSVGGQDAVIVNDGANDAIRQIDVIGRAFGPSCQSHFRIGKYGIVGSIVNDDRILPPN